MDNGKYSGDFNRAEIGRYSLNEPPNSVRLTGARVLHPNWDTTKRPYNDIMLVKLLEPAMPTDSIIQLNRDEDIPGAEGTPIVVIGFGSIENPSENGGNVILPRILQETIEEYVPKEICQFACDPNNQDNACYGTPDLGTVVTDDWFCTISSDPRSGVCNGGTLRWQGILTDESFLSHRFGSHDLCLFVEWIDSGGPNVLEGDSIEEDLLVGVISS
jgi:hypothetical protein